MSDLLYAEKISKSFDGRSLFEELSFSLPDRGMVAICGKSGCGKSTLLHILASLEEPSRGHLLWNGQKIDGGKLSDFRKDIGILFQSFYLLEDQTILYNLSLPFVIAKKPFDLARAKKLAKALGLQDKSFDEPCAPLSGGEKRRVALLRALLPSPKILFCDEPTSGLDLAHQEKVESLLFDEAKERLIIIVTHDSKLASRCDRVIFLGGAE